MSYLEDFDKLLKERCRQNEPPFCAAACPFGLDLRDLAEKWQKGRFNAAYRAFANAVGFPEIVAAGCPHPCESACLRARCDGAVSLHRLEQATVRHATRKTPNSYNMPPKGQSVAIVGAGLSGLGCALLLCNRKYDVTIFEKTHRLGGRLWDELDPALFLKDIETQFKNEKYTLRLDTEITDLSVLGGFDAVYVATGAGNLLPGLIDDPGGALASRSPGVFYGGALRGRDSMAALADGLLAARAVERYLKTGLMNQPRPANGTALEMDAAHLPPAPPVSPADGESYTESEAQAEAARCVRCACDACMRGCDLLRLFDKTPRRLYEEVYITVRPGTIAHEGTWATRLISTCEQCGLCKSVCPQRIDVGAFLLESHRHMREKDAMPWAFHDYWLRDMAFSDGEAALLLPGPNCGDKPKTVFFPGCQMGASEPEYVRRSFAWLLAREPDTALWLRCCGAPAEWAGDEALHGESVAEIRQQWETLGRPQLVFGCPTCARQFAKYLPELQGRFLPELLAEAGVKLADDAGGAACAVFDPCAARDFPALRESVRALTARLPGLTQLPHQGGESRCCGWGGQTSIAQPDFARAVTRDRLAEGDGAYITYCVNCRDSFAAQGKPVFHLLDLVFGLHGPGRPAPTLTQRWDNRRALKQALLAQYGAAAPERSESGMQLFMDEPLRQQLSRDMILESDMAQVIDWCEREGRRVLDPETGHYIGHKKIQNMTYWAEYAPEGQGWRLFGGYAHRMCLEAEE